MACRLKSILTVIFVLPFIFSTNLKANDANILKIQIDKDLFVNLTFAASANFANPTFTYFTNEDSNELWVRGRHLRSIIPAFETIKLDMDLKNTLNLRFKDSFLTIEIVPSENARNENTLVKVDPLAITKQNWGEPQNTGLQTTYLVSARVCAPYKLCQTVRKEIGPFYYVEQPQGFDD